MVNMLEQQFFLYTESWLKKSTQDYSTAPTELSSQLFSIYILSKIIFMIITHHVVISIRWLENHLASFKSKDKRRLYCYDVHGMSDTDVYAEIEKYKSIWYTVIPNEDCNNLSPEWKCLWHDNN